MTSSRLINRDISDISICTTASIRNSGSSKLLLRNGSRTSVKANRTTKYKVKGAGGGGRWRAPARRDASLTSIMGRRQSSRDMKPIRTLSSTLGRGFETLRLANNRNESFNVNGASVDVDSDPHICIKSVELQQALHRDIDSQSVASDGSKGQDRWSSKSGGGNTLYKPTRRKSDDNLG